MPDALGSTTSRDGSSFGAVAGRDCSSMLSNDAFRYGQAKPVPFASSRVETKASNKFGSTCAGMPGPFRAQRNKSSSGRRAAIVFDSTRIDPAAGTAINAFRSRLTKTCISRSAFPTTALRASTVFSKRTSAAFSSIATRLQLSSINGRSSTGSRLSLRCRAKSSRLSLIFRKRCVTRSIRSNRSRVCASSVRFDQLLD